MDIFRRIKIRELIFSATGLLLLILICGGFIAAINFLFNNMAIAIQGSATENNEIVKFNLEQYKGLGIAARGSQTPSANPTITTPTSTSPTSTPTIKTKAKGQ